jgi:hypothetical protein
MVGKRVEAGCCRRPTGGGYAVFSIPQNFGRSPLAKIVTVSTVLIGLSRDGAKTFIMPCAVGVHAEKFTMLGAYSLQWQGHHSPTSNCIEGVVSFYSCPLFVAHHLSASGSMGLAGSEAVDDPVAVSSCRLRHDVF